MCLLLALQFSPVESSFVIIITIITTTTIIIMIIINILLITIKAILKTCNINKNVFTSKKKCRQDIVIKTNDNNNNNNLNNF